MSEVYTPNIKKLLLKRLSVIAIPPGSGDRAFQLGAELFLDKDKIKAKWQEAEDWVSMAIDQILSAPDCPFPGDREAVAGAILDTAEKREHDLFLKLMP